MLEKIVTHLGGDVQRFRALWANAASPPSASTRESDLIEFIDQYRSAVATLHRHIQPANFEALRRVPIDKLYVIPTLRSAGGDRLEVQEILSETSENRRFVILGDPGSGKSTLCQFLAYHAGTTTRFTGNIPFVIRIRDFTRGALPIYSIVEYIENECRAIYQTPPPEGVVEQLLHDGRAIVILDGLDELLNASQRIDLVKIVELFAKKFSHSKVVVTSRRVGYLEAPLDSDIFATFHLEGFDDDTQVERYVTGWFSIDESRPQSEREELARTFLLESSSFTDLRSSPLLLSLMCTLYRNSGWIPSNRTALIEECADLLFNRWDRARGINSRLRNDHVMRPALGHLALLMLENTQHSFVGRRQAIRELTSFFEQRYDDRDEAELMAQEFMDYSAGRAWVFSDVGSRGHEHLYSFTHRTFLEYFAATHLARASRTPDNLAAALSRRIANGEWMAVGQFAVKYFDEIRQGGGAELLVSMAANSKHQSPEKNTNVVSFIVNSLDLVELSAKVRSELLELINETGPKLEANDSNAVP